MAGRSMPLGGPRQRAVIAVLAAEVGSPVPVESLIDRVWGDAPPLRVRHSLHVYIARFRRLLERQAAATAPARVVRRSAGYTLVADPASVDSHRFRLLVSRAGEPGQADPERAALLGRALDLWRGPPLADLAGQWPAQLRQAWQQQQLRAVVAWAETCLRLGDPDRVLGRLGELAAEHPMVESLAAALMRTLCAAGRPSEALSHYERVRRLLADELGVDPGPGLRQLHREILTAGPVPAAPDVPRALPVPHQLPAPPRYLTGRGDELARLGRAAADGSTLVIAVIDGMAGVGKTALALHAAHRTAGRYPDGQLFVDLHGHAAGVAPVQPGEALDRLLRSLGVAGDHIPVDLDDRAALYRSRLSGRRMVILLDNAADEAQVTPLLPGASGCLVLVTSRNRLIGLDDGRSISLDPLPPADAVGLFVRTVGEDRLAGQPAEATAEVVELCGRLPLAVKIAAARLSGRPAWTVTDLLRRLRGRQHRLAELAAGPRSVTAALDLSYQQLSAGAQRTYRRLGLHPGADIDLHAAAAMAEVPLVRAGQLLDELLDAHLLQEPTCGRYAFHELVRAHAAAMAGSERDRRSPVRLLDHYLHTAAVAMDLAYPYERGLRPPVAPAATPVPAMVGPAAAMAWLDTEFSNLVSAARYAADSGWPDRTIGLSAVLRRHLRTRGRYREAELLHGQALAAARSTGDRAGALAALLGLGNVCRLQARFGAARDHFGLAWELARDTGSPGGEMNALIGLGHLAWVAGGYEQAAGHFERALVIASHAGLPVGEQDARVGLGWVLLRQGAHRQAAGEFARALAVAEACGYQAGEMNALLCRAEVAGLRGRFGDAAADLERAGAIARDVDHRSGELSALLGLARVDRQQGRYEDAGAGLARALEIARVTGHRPGEMDALLSLGDLDRLTGDSQRAAGHFRRALALAREIPDANWEFEAIQGLGRVLLDTGQPEPALDHHRRALILATELRQPTDQARAHDGLAHAYQALHRRGPARRHWRQALDLLTCLGLDHTHEPTVSVTAIRSRLSRTSAEDREDDSPQAAC